MAHSAPVGRIDDLQGCVGCNAHDHCDQRGQDIWRVARVDSGPSGQSGVDPCVEVDPCVGVGPCVEVDPCASGRCVSDRCV